ncbi:MAG: hypothetical protein HXS44_04320 [Theionarchaea archaeon]|nr:hypothetical protein [Theionarchaea archaeon]
MRKMIVLLLVIGLFVGTFATDLSGCEESFSQETFSFSEENSADSLGDPLPCSGEGSGGGGGQPG